MDLLLVSCALLQFTYSILSPKSEDAGKEPFQGCLTRSGEMMPTPNCGIQDDMVLLRCRHSFSFFEYNLGDSAEIEMKRERL